MKRRLFALALALLLAVSLPVLALARDWDIDEGDITFRATENGQTVSQGETTEADDAPVIKQKDSSKSTSNTITIDPPTLSRGSASSTANTGKNPTQTGSEMKDWWNGDWYGWWKMTECPGN